MANPHPLICKYGVETFRLSFNPSPTADSDQNWNFLLYEKKHRLIWPQPTQKVRLWVKLKLKALIHSCVAMWVCPLDGGVAVQGLPITLGVL